jgi:hypothetical protein
MKQWRITMVRSDNPGTKSNSVFRKTRRQIAKSECAAQCEKFGMKVIYVDEDSTKIQGMSYDHVIIDDYINLEELEK